MASIRNTLLLGSAVVSASLVPALHRSAPIVGRGTPETCANPVLSCSLATPPANTCCYNSPGGSLLQTQFWDTDPTTGPSNSWTIHGLWPDNCDGTYVENCDSSRDYTGISTILTNAGKTDLLDYMNTYWKNQGASDETLWEHEWATHGTCISTLDTSCYTDYTKYDELIDFLTVTTGLFKGLDTYGVLSAAGIVPSSTKTYTLAAIQAALKASFGQIPVVGCSSGALDQLFYGYQVKGSVQTGTFVPVAPLSSSTCPSTGIKYLPKSGAAVTTSVSTKTTTKSSTSTTSTSAGGTGTPFSGKGFLEAYTGGSNQGCLISGGTWYVGGTCATFTAVASGSTFTLSSSKGSCGIVSGAFSCASGVTATSFTAIGGLLAYNGKTAFSAPAIPSGSVQETVTTGTGTVAVTFEFSAS